LKQKKTFIGLGPEQNLPEADFFLQRFKFQDFLRDD